MIPYLIRSWRGGISDEADKGISGSFKFGYGMDIHKKKDTFSCGQAMQTISNPAVVTDWIRWFVPCTKDGTTYCFGNGGRIYSRAGNEGALVFRYADANGDIKGAHEWVIDDGSTYIVWATDTSVSRKLMIGSNSGMDWGNVELNWKKDLTPNSWHTMKMACGNLMICNDLYLAMIDYTGAYTNDALNLRPGNLTKCLEERDDYVIIGSTREDNDEKGYIWSWITTALNYVQKKKIPAEGVNALIYTEYPLLQAGDDGQIFYSDFTNMIPVHAIPGGGKVQPGGVTEDENLALFGFYDGSYPGIWSYGRKNKNRPSVLNYEYRLAKTASGSTVTNIGTIANINSEILATWKTIDGSTNEYGVDCASSTTKATALYEGLEFDAGAPHLKKNFQTAKVTMEPLPAGCSIALKYKIDRGSWVTAKTADKKTSFSTTDATEAEFIINDDGKVFEVGLTLTPSANLTPEVLSIVTYLGSETEMH